MKEVIGHLLKPDAGYISKIHSVVWYSIVRY